ncbi:hypothetical protein EAO71_23370 [Streptomyces sp. ms191]|uniref:Imm50 family immunity protein n=1 Tax=Streptomyces sp. ms191 TaxID=1827978 RepID=UPI0011CEC9D4|nr:Imm50 family immunity protein [Streptomyces sp. ms191]TXS22466.1 hypothetical protein EAO71_23370 [Streptomyces sp. ms191]
MSWTSFLTNPVGIETIYGGHPPELAAVPLHAVDFSREGPLLTLRFDMPSYPETPPKKWSVQGFDTAQVTMALAGVRTVSLTGFTSDPVVDIVLSGGDGVAVEICSDSVQLQASAAVVYIAQISGYRTAGAAGSA